MLRLYASNCASKIKVAVESAARLQSTAAGSTGHKFQTKEQKKDGTTYVSMERVTDSRGARKDDELCSLCTCNVPVKLSYKDVLILEQFMRDDGTVLPRQLTGLCKKQQLRLERCVMQAFWSGLFGEKYGNEADRAGYKRFNRYWKDDMSMYQLETKERHGTWFYIKRYQTKNQPLFKNPLN
ncbi:unnamed protein product [Caenorhabditis nigoni]|uniref:28S ribosomal protein S18a, mitochondrial n=1 Tax=Caenorhabditis nigoni TaxID=1611254 RepID=A0A2G5UG43_9PELO|nr:hypothetical protein B9Z55_010352 [Caenorhabditis nigoni]